MVNSIKVSLTEKKRNIIWQALYGIRATGRYGPDNRRHGHPNKELDVVDEIMEQMKVT
jgi:hypothetical protein